LGLEESGELISKIGQYAVLAGTALTTLGPIITGIVGKLVAGGLSTAAAWGWVAGVALVIGALVAAAVMMYENYKKNSPEEKLKRAQEST
jgi:MFS family permease